MKLGIEKWQVHEAYPPTDIIWSEIDQLAKEAGICKHFWITFFNITMSLTLFVFLSFGDTAEIFHDYSLKLISRYFCPLSWAFYSLYLNPWLVFKMIKWEYTPLKSAKEQSFLSKFNLSLVFNLTLIPFMGYFMRYYITQIYLANNASDSDPNLNPIVSEWIVVQETLQIVSSFYFRLLSQAVLICFIF